MEFEFLTIEDLDVRDKTVFLRVDVNSPLNPSTHEILDDSRIRATKETLECLVDAKVVLGSHQSRPGKDDFTSLEAHAKLLQKYCSQKVVFIDDVIGPFAKKAIRELKNGEVLVLDNLRLCAEENVEATPEKLAKTHLVQNLYPLLNLYVNDAFAAAHRSQPSLVGFAEILPSAAGKLMERELRSLNAVLGEPARPSIYVLGGAKAEDKVPVIENILKNGKADKILLGGVIAKIFLKARGCSLGRKEDAEIKNFETFINKAKEIMANYGENVELPADFAVNRNGARAEVSVEKLPVEEAVLDVGRKTVEKYIAYIARAKTVVANGPLGVFEKNEFEYGTKSILKAISKCNAFTMIGGGHLAGFAGMLGIEKNFSHVSTAGGAMLSALAGQSLPAVEALVRFAAKYRK